MTRCLSVASLICDITTSSLSLLSPQAIELGTAGNWKVKINVARGICPDSGRGVEVIFS